MAPSHPQSYEGSLVDSHEERIKGLEGNRSEVASQLAAQTVQLDYLRQTIDSGLASLGDGLLGLGNKMELMVAPITAQLKAVEATTITNAGTISELQATNTAREEKRKARFETWKKVVVGLVLAGAGALGKEGATFLWQLFTK